MGVPLPVQAYQPARASGLPTGGGAPMLRFLNALRAGTPTETAAHLVGFTTPAAEAVVASPLVKALLARGE